MDFLDPKKKRANSTRLFIGYGLMVIAIGIATTIIAFEAFGYGIDRKGGVIQNGLLFVDTHPEQAEIILNGESKGQTDARLVLPEGQYTVELKREGYRDWKRSFRLVGSKIERLTYPFLFPQNFDKTDVQLYSDTPQFSTQSPDRKWVLVQQPGALNIFDLTDLSQENPNPVVLTIPTTLFTKIGSGTHSLSLADWSTDNRHVLLKHNFPGGVEFIMVDRENVAASQNINKTFNTPFVYASLRDKKFDQIYILSSDGLLQLGNLGTGQITPVLTKVLAYETYSTEEILFITSDGAPKDKVLVKIRTADKIHNLRELPAGDKAYLVDISKYDGAWYMAVGASAEKKAYIYKEPFDTLNRTVGNTIPIPQTVLKTDFVGRQLSFSANTRFIALQGGNQFSVYDAEMDRLHRYDTKLKITDTEKALWMDGHRLTMLSEGTVQVFDYEGSNQQSLLTVNGTHQPFFDRDYNRLFTIGPSVSVKGKPAFIQSFVRVEADR